MIVTVGRLRSGSTSTERRRAASAPNTTRRPAAASTRMRFLSDWVTMNVNIAHLSDLIEKLGALYDHAPAGRQAIQHHDALGIERLHPDDARLETLARRVLEQDRLAVGAAQDARTWHRDAFRLLAGRRKHR